MFMCFPKFLTIDCYLITTFEHKNIISVAYFYNFLKFGRELVNFKNLTVCSNFFSFFFVPTKKAKVGNRNEINSLLLKMHRLSNKKKEFLGLPMQNLVVQNKSKTFRDKTNDISTSNKKSKIN